MDFGGGDCCLTTMSRRRTSEQSGSPEAEGDTADYGGGEPAVLSAPNGYITRS